MHTGGIWANFQIKEFLEKSQVIVSLLRDNGLYHNSLCVAQEVRGGECTHPCVSVCVVLCAYICSVYLCCVPVYVAILCCVPIYVAILCCVPVYVAILCCVPVYVAILCCVLVYVAILCCVPVDVVAPKHGFTYFAFTVMYCGLYIQVTCTLLGPSPFLGPCRLSTLLIIVWLRAKTLLFSKAKDRN